VVASYLASHNAPDTDFFLFTTRNKGKRRSRKTAAGQAEEDVRLGGCMSTENQGIRKCIRTISTSCLKEPLMGLGQIVFSGWTSP
jgi:hypothetical protein